MKKGPIIAVLLLVSALGAIGAGYQFYVKERLLEFNEHKLHEEQLRKKISDLETQFQRTDPSVIIETWRGQTQPWKDAVVRRSKYFNLGDTGVPELVPEEKTPRFYYRDEYPKRFDGLQQEAWDHSCLLTPMDFEVPPPSTLGGTRPTSGAISGYLTRIERGKSVVRMLLEANATSIQTVSLWRGREGSSGQGGRVMIRTAGLRFTITMADLSKFMQDLQRRPRYFNVDALMLSNRFLRYPAAQLEVEMILSEAIYRERVGGPGVDGGAVPMLDPVSAFALRGTSGLFSRNNPQRSDGPSGWQRFRKKYIPF